MLLASGLVQGIRTKSCPFVLSSQSSKTNRHTEIIKDVQERDEADKESLLSRQSVLLGELYELTQPLVGAFRHESAYFWIVTTGHMFVKASTLAFRCYTGHYRAHVALATRTQSSHFWLVYLAPQHFSLCASTEFDWLHCCTASRSRTPSCTG